MHSKRKMLVTGLASSVVLLLSTPALSEQTFFTTPEAVDIGFAVEPENYLSAHADISGDGIPDLITRENQSSNNQLIEWNIVLGDSSGFSKDEIRDDFPSFEKLNVVQTTEGTTSVTNEAKIIGDINGDGIQDVVFGYNIVFGTTSFPNSLHLSNVIENSDLNGTNGFIIFSSSSLNVNNTIGGVGDINGDGVDDYFLIDSTDRSKVYIIFGSSHQQTNVLDISTLNLNGTNGFVIDNLDNNSTPITAHGDFNGDGLSDFVIYSVSNNPNNSAVIFLGKSSNFTATYSYEDFLGSNPAAYVIQESRALYNAGDLNGDNIDDLVNWNYSESYLIYGSLSYTFGGTYSLLNLESNNLAQLASTRVDFGPPIYIFPAGDVNNDGLDDLLFSEWLKYLKIEGISHKYRSLLSVSMYPDQPAYSIGDPYFEGSNLDSALPLGDLNRDGYDDFRAGSLIFFGTPNIPEKRPYQVITSYRSAFKGPVQSSGWNYSSGNSDAHMKWTGWNYDDDGISGPNNISSVGYGNLNAVGGHPGKGSQSSNVIRDVPVIASYRVGQSGEYAIQDSFIEHGPSSCSSWSNGGNVLVKISGHVRKEITYFSNSRVNFDTELGLLRKGTEIEVHFGPNGSDGCDAFKMDFAISLRGSLKNTSPVISDIPDQVSQVGEPISPIEINLFDAENDEVTFRDETVRPYIGESLVRLPEGIRINNTSEPNVYRLEGIPTRSENYTAYIPVEDSYGADNFTDGATDFIRFNWQVGSKGSTLSNYLEDFGDSENWSYLWNANSSLGDSKGYVPLVWNGYDYRSGEASYPATSELKYGFLGPKRGHPGSGTSNGASTDRYVISAYTFSEAGNFSITDSSLTTTCEWSNGLDAHVYLNDQVIPPASDFYDGINRNLGAVEAGDTVYVAIGPNGSHGCDAFLIDYSIEYNE